MPKPTKLELYVADCLKKILDDPNIRPTKNSGGGQRNTEIGDILNKHFAIECKESKIQKNIIIHRQVWNKIKGEIPFEVFKIPILIKENKYGDRMIGMDLEDWFNLLQRINWNE